MYWLFFAIAAPAVYAIVNYVDKYIVKSGLVDFRSMPVYSGLMGVLAGTLFWVSGNFPCLDYKSAIIVAFTGMLTLGATVLYFDAINTEATSKVIILLQLVPLIVLGLSVVFLGETVGPRQLLGFCVVMLATGGMVFASGEVEDGRRFPWPKLTMVILADILWAASSVLLKFGVEHNSTYTIFIYQSWGAAIGGLILLGISPQTRTAFLRSTKIVGWQALSLILLNEGIFFASKGLNIIAVSMGPVSLVSVLGSTQVFFGIIYGWIFTKLAPAIYEEDLSSQGVTRELLLAAGMVMGIWLLY